MNSCSILASANLSSASYGWTFHPYPLMGYYPTYYESYTATISTTITFTEMTLVTMTFLCMSSLPSDFNIQVNLPDRNIPLDHHCQSNSTWTNTTVNLKDFPEGSSTITLQIKVNGGIPNSQWLRIDQIWIEGCPPPSDHSLWWISLVIGLVLLIMALVIYHIRSRHKYTLIPTPSV